MPAFPLKSPFLLYLFALYKLRIGLPGGHRSGDKIPADLRFIWCNAAKVDNSSLTGEAVPLTRTGDIAKRDSSREAENMGFFGTTLVTGSAVGLVVRTGDRYIAVSVQYVRGLSLGDAGYGLRL